MKEITSRDNPFLKRLRKLLASSAARREAGETVLDGPHLIAAYMDDMHGLPVEIAVSRSGMDASQIGDLLDRVDEKSITVVEDTAFKTLSPSDTPSGIVAVVPVLKRTPLPGANCLLLESVQDPGNVGALLRTARAAGFGEVYLSPGCADVWSPKCLRGGMGAHFGLCLAESADLIAVLQTFPGRSVACDPQAHQTLYEVALSAPLAVVVGAEGAGLSSALLRATTDRCRIPMCEGTQSLNAGVAGAIVMYEHVRQQLAFSAHPGQRSA